MQRINDNAFDYALIGVTIDDRAVYDYDVMVHGLVERDGMEEDEAREFIDYNTIRNLPFMGAQAPIIIHRLDDEEIN